MSFLGLHLSASSTRDLYGLGDYLRACHDGGSPVPVVVSVDVRLVDELQWIGCWAFRTQKSRLGADNPDAFAIWADPDQAGIDWIDSLDPIWRKNPGARYYITNNELDPADPRQAARLDDWTLSMLRHNDQIAPDRKLGIYSFGPGNPKGAPDGADWTDLDIWEALLPSTLYAAAHGHAVILHNHPLTADLRTNAEWVSLRHRRAVKFWQEKGIHPLPTIILGETSNSAGGIDPNLSAYMDNVRWLDEQLMAERPRVVAGACLYQLGGAETIRPALPTLQTYLISHPTLPIPDPDPVPAPIPTLEERVQSLEDRVRLLELRQR